MFIVYCYYIIFYGIHDTYLPYYYVPTCTYILVHVTCVAYLVGVMWYRSWSLLQRSNSWLAFSYCFRRGTEFSILTRTPARWLAIRWGVTAKYISNRKRANRLTSRWRITYGVRFITLLSWRIERNYRATSIPPPRVCNPLGAISHSTRSFLQRILDIFLHQ